MPDPTIKLVIFSAALGMNIVAVLVAFLWPL